MTTATIVLCPPLPGSEPSYDPADVVDVLLDDPRTSRLRAMSPYVPDPDPGDDDRTARSHWVAHLAIGLATGGAQAPVLLVLAGTSGAMAPAVGFSQRASRRAVSGYVLVDAAVPPAESRGGDWPDAPVHYVASPAAEPLEVNQARLRGWTVHEVPEGTAVVVADVVAAIATA